MRRFENVPDKRKEKKKSCCKNSMPCSKGYTKKTMMKGQADHIKLNGIHRPQVCNVAHTQTTMQEKHNTHTCTSNDSKLLVTGGNNNPNQIKKQQKVTVYRLKL